jgi:stage V sporulation protein R
VHLQTVVEEQPTMMSYDGTEHSMKTMGDSDDPRKHSSGKAK